LLFWFDDFTVELLIRRIHRHLKCTVRRLNTLASGNLGTMGELPTRQRVETSDSAFHMTMDERYKQLGDPDFDVGSW
jgi:hypothetical protein